MFLFVYTIWDPWMLAVDPQQPGEVVILKDRTPELESECLHLALFKALFLKKVKYLNSQSL